MKRYLVTVNHSGTGGAVRQEYVPAANKAAARAVAEGWIAEDGWLSNNRPYLKISVGVAR